MKQKILNNFSLKILSIICAIILWAVIVNIYDPSTSVTVTGVTVVLENTDSLTGKDYTYEVVDGSKISVYISGPRSIVSDIKASDIIATADLSTVTAFSDYADINVKLSKEGVSASSIEITPKTTAIKLNIENRISKTVNVEVETVGAPAKGYVVGDTKISPTTVKITGAASAIENVKSVKAIYDVSGVSMDISDIASLALYDASGNAISNNKIELGKNEVDFKATILPSKEVPIKFKSQGEVAAGYTLTGIDYSSTQAVIAGTEENLKLIDAIEVSSDAIDISGLNADKEFAVNIGNYVPSNVLLLSDGKLTATARVSKLTEKQYTIALSSASITNLPTGYTSSFGNEKEIVIVVTGTENVLSSIVEADLKPVLNLTGTAEGLNSVRLSVTLPIGAKLKQDYEVKVTLTNTQSEPKQQ